MSLMKSAAGILACSTFVGLAGVMTQNVDAAAPAKAPTNTKPNVIYILADDAGMHNFGAYGGTMINTPNIDRLAERGMKFTQHYAGASVCGPSRCVLMTGLHTGHALLRSNIHNMTLRSEDVTIGEVMKVAGYTTGAIGKWGLGMEFQEGAPNSQGFDFFYGYLDQSNAHQYYPEHMWRNNKMEWLRGNQRRRNQYSHDLFANEALNFIDRNKDKPFFLYLPFTLPHTELTVPEDSMKEYEGKFVEEGSHWLDTFEQTKPRQTYAAMVSRLDRTVGEVMAKIEELGLSENTIIMFASDNGGDEGGGSIVTDYFKSNYPYSGKKRTFYEGGVRVPFIVSWPGKIKAGTSTDHMSGFQDILPTFADIANVQNNQPTDGISFLPTLLGDDKSQVKHDYMYWEHNSTRYHNGKRINCQALRYGDWKLLRFVDPETPAQVDYELYNLKDDIQETTNVAKAKPEVVYNLIQKMESVRTPSELFPLAYYNKDKKN